MSVRKAPPAAVLRPVGGTVPSQGDAPGSESAASRPLVAVWPRRLGLAAVVLTTFLFAIGGGIARAGDAELAKFLLKGACEDLGGKRYDDAIKKLRRVLEEDPTRIEALYWRGVALEKKADLPGALDAYRAFVVPVDAKGAAGGSSKEEQDLQRKAQARVDALSAGEGELAKLDDAFVGALLAFAKANSVKDPVIAVRALDALIAVRPGHEEARGLREKLGPWLPGSAAAPAGAEKQTPGDADASPFRAVKAWTDLIAGRAFGTNDGWEYEKGVLVIDRAGAGALARPGKGMEFEAGSAYAYELECRFGEVRGESPIVGLAFGINGGNLLLAILGPGFVVLHEEHEDARYDRSRTEVASFDASGWHRLGVLVKGQRVGVWLDGKRVAEYTVEDRPDLAGGLGLEHQHCRVEIRTLRWGPVR